MTVTMNNLDMYLVIFIFFVTWKGTKTLEGLPFPFLTFESEVDGDTIIQNGTGTYIYLAFNNYNNNYNSARLLVKCESDFHHGNMVLQICRVSHPHDRALIETSSYGDNVLNVTLTGEEIESGDYSCLLFLQKNVSGIKGGVTKLANRVTATLSLILNEDGSEAVCFSNKGNVGLKNEFITLSCVTPQLPTTSGLTWGAIDGLLCTASLEITPNYIVSQVCALTDDWLGKNLSCGNYTSQDSKGEWNAQCSLGEIKILEAQELFIFPKDFYDSDAQQLTFTCTSNPSLYPLQWYVFTNEGILTFDDLWNGPLLINVKNSYVYGNSTLTISRANDDSRNIQSVVCSASVGEEGRRLNAIYRVGSETPDIGWTSAVPVSKYVPTFFFSSTSMPLPTPNTFATIVNEISQASYQTERVIYLITLVFLLLLILVLLVYLMKSVFVPKMKSKQGKDVYGSTPSLQPNPAYVSYDGDPGIPGNDVV